MIQEDYVSFETAELLKEKGFAQTTDYFYSKQSEKKYPEQLSLNELNYQRSSFIPAPTLQMATKWLREVHGMYIETNVRMYTSPKTKVDGFLANVWYLPKNNKGMCCVYAYPPNHIAGECWDTYEQACEAAITYCLTKLL